MGILPPLANGLARLIQGFAITSNPVNSRTVQGFLRQARGIFCGRDIGEVFQIFLVHPPGKVECALLNDAFVVFLPNLCRHSRGVLITLCPRIALFGKLIALFVK